MQLYLTVCFARVLDAWVRFVLSHLPSPPPPHPPPPPPPPQVFLGRYEKDLMKKHPSLVNMQVGTKEKEEEEEKKKDTRTETAKDH